MNVTHKGQIPVDVPIQELKGRNQQDYVLLVRIGSFAQFNITSRGKQKNTLKKSKVRFQFLISNHAQFLKELFYTSNFITQICILFLSSQVI